MRTSVLFLLMLTFVWSCGSAPRRTQSRFGSEPTVKVTVENQNLLDMTVYVLSESHRERLGLVPSLNASVFYIPQRPVAGAASIQLLADPIGSTDTPVSQRFSVSSGEEIEMVITNTRSQ